MSVNIDWAEVLSVVVSGILSYLAGHRRGRKVHRSGDYLVIPPEEDK